MIMICIILGFVFGCLVGIIIMSGKTTSVERVALSAEAKRIAKEWEAEKKERKRLRKLFRNRGNSNIIDVAQGKC